MRGAVRSVLGAVLALLLWSAAGAATQAPDFVVIFGTGAAELSPEGQQVVALIAQRAKEQHPARIAVAGYGDADDGKDAALADRRASAVMRGLTSAGVAPALIKEVPRESPATATGIPVHKVTVTFLR